MKIESYIFVHSGPLHTMMLQSCYALCMLLFCYADVLSRLSIGPLALFLFFWQENEFNICVGVLFPYILVINHILSESLVKQ